MKSHYATVLVSALLASLAHGNDEPPNHAETVTNTVEMELKLIQAGTFQMGSPASDEGKDGISIVHEKPQHQVRFSRDFYLGVTEVTQGQWEAVMDTRPWAVDKYVTEGAEYPATYVSWDDAVAFCRRLSAKEGVTYRLPTEAEWEYACRAGTTTNFSFGDDEKQLGDYAWFQRSVRSHALTQPIFAATLSAANNFVRPIPPGGAQHVGTKRPNQWGLHDMHGNVYEWCQDRAGDYGYESSAAVDPAGPPKGPYRVFRGGHWHSSAYFCRSAYRTRNSPEMRSCLLGFRVARVLSQ